MTHLLGIEQFGTYALVVTTAGFVKQVFDARSQDIITRYLPRAVVSHNGAGVRRTIVVALGVEALVTAIAAGCLIAFGADIAGIVLHATGKSAIITMGGLLVLATLGASTSRGILVVSDRFMTVGIADALTAVVILLGSVFVMRLAPSVTAFIYVAVLGALTATAFLSVAASRTVRSLLRECRSPSTDIRLGEVFRFAFGANVLGTIRLFQSSGPTLLLGTLLSTQSAGVYYFALRVAGYLNSALSPLLVVARARISNWAASSLSSTRALLGRTVGILALLCAPPIIGTLLGGSALIALLFGEAYQASFQPTLVALLGTAIGVTVTPIGYFVLVRGSIVVNNLIYLAATLAQYASLLLLVYSYGALGASVALLIYYSVVATLLAIYAKRLLDGSADRVQAEAASELLGRRSERSSSLGGAL
jgi:O-antigen/teichoic acid export membrane protein